MYTFTNIIKIIQNKYFEYKFIKNGGFRTLLYQKNKIDIQELIIKGVNVNLKDKSGNTALHYACMLHDNQIIKTLINNKINLEIKNKKGETALFKICGLKINYDYFKTDIVTNFDKAYPPEKSLSIANYLIQAGANIHTTDNNKNTLLIGAAYNQNTELFIKLLNLGCKHNIKNNNNQDGFDYCLKMKNIEILTFIYSQTESSKEKEILDFKMIHHEKIIEKIKNDTKIIEINFILNNTIPMKPNNKNKLIKI